MIGKQNEVKTQRSEKEAGQDEIKMNLEDEFIVQMNLNYQSQSYRRQTLEVFSKYREQKNKMYDRMKEQILRKKIGQLKKE